MKLNRTESCKLIYAINDPHVFFHSAISIRFFYRKVVCIYFNLLRVPLASSAPGNFGSNSSAFFSSLLAEKIFESINKIKLLRLIKKASKNLLAFFNLVNRVLNAT